MRSDAQLEPIKRVEVPASDESLTNILLTGPTGFFGPFLLSSLLRRTPYTYYALTRAKDPIHGMDRIPGLAWPRPALDASPRPGAGEAGPRRVR